MPTNSTDQGLVLPIDPDAADTPTMMQSYNGGAENRLFRRYTSEADRTARTVSTLENSVSSLADVDRAEISDGANWISLAHRANYFVGMRSSDAAAINNSTAFVSDAVMTVALATPATYMVDGSIYYDSSNAADFKMNLTWPGGTSGRVVVWGLDPAGTTQIGSLKQGVTTASGTSFVFIGAGVGTATFCKFEGRLVTAGAGSLIVQYAQAGADATNTTVRSGSFLRVIRVL